jgi:hypothetical protein
MAAEAVAVVAAGGDIKQRFEEKHKEAPAVAGASFVKRLTTRLTTSNMGLFTPTMPQKFLVVATGVHQGIGYKCIRSKTRSL